MSKLPAIGKATPTEKEFTDYLLDCIADYVQAFPTERRTMIAALSTLCQIIFCQETHFDIKGQCNEIDDFCHFLKSFAMRHAKKD